MADAELIKDLEDIAAAADEGDDAEEGIAAQAWDKFVKKPLQNGDKDLNDLLPKFGLEKKMNDEIRLTGQGYEKFQLPNNGTFTSRDGTQTIFTGRASEGGKLESISVNADGTINVSSEGATIRQKGNKTIVTTTGGEQVIIGPNGIEQYRAGGRSVDILQPKKDVVNQLEQAQLAKRLDSAVEALAAGKLNVKELDYLHQKFGDELAGKINKMLEAAGSKFRLGSELVAAEKMPGGARTYEYRLIHKPSGQVVVSEQITRPREVMRRAK